MPKQAAVQMPEIKPGLLVWMGRFRNRAGIISRVWDEDDKPKYEVIPIPQGRKHPKQRNLLPFKPMDEADSAKYRKMYDDEQREKSRKTARVAERFAKSAKDQIDGPDVGTLVWASECGMHRVVELSEGYQSQFKTAGVWFEDETWPSMKAALRAFRGVADGQ